MREESSRQNNKITRREALSTAAKVAAGVVVAGVVGGAIGYQLGGAAKVPAEKEVTVTSTKMITKTVTAAKKLSGKLEWWIGSWSEGAAKALAQTFMEAFPDVEIEVVALPWEGMYEKIFSALQSPSPPEVIDVAVAWNPPWAALGLLTPLEDFARKLDLTDFYESALETARWEGKLYGIPFRTETGGLIANKKILEESGLDPNTLPKTWDEFYLYCKKTTIPGERYGYSTGVGQPDHAVFEFSTFLWGNGGDYLSEDYSKPVFNSPEGVEALEFLCKLYREGLIPKDAPSITRDDAREQYFIPERSAMEMGAVYYLPTIRDKNPELYKNLIIDVMPKNKEDVERYVQIGGWNRVIPSKCKDPELAWTFIAFLSSPMNQAFYTHTFPARESGLEFPNYYGTSFKDPYVKMFSKCLPTGRLTPPVAAWGIIRDEIAKAVVSALMGEKTPKQALDEAAENVKEALKEAAKEEKQ